MDVILEAFAVVFNLAYVVLAIFQNALCWPAGLFGACLTFLIFFKAQLYGAMALQGVYMGLMVYGWYQWRRGGEEGGQLAVSRMPMRSGVLAVIGGALFTVGLGLFLMFRTDAVLPFWDAGTTSFSLVAQFMTTRKWIENWVVWIAVDVAYVGMLITQDLHLMAGLYAAYLILAVIGLVKWRRSLGAGSLGKDRA
jgi:nicotinamide mononucleotide transporter